MTTSNPLARERDGIRRVFDDDEIARLFAISGAGFDGHLPNELRGRISRFAALVDSLLDSGMEPEVVHSLTYAPCIYVDNRTPASLIADGDMDIAALIYLVVRRGFRSGDVHRGATVHDLAEHRRRRTSHPH